MSAPRITPFLWFNRNAEEAVTFYISIFPNSRRVSDFITPSDTPAAPAGSLLAIDFELNGQPFTALNGGPGYPFTEAVSFLVPCDTQAEIDSYWSRLLEDGGQEIQCGWLKDRFGLAWQIVPANWNDLIATAAGMERMMTMKKFNIAELEAAGKS